MDFHINDPRVDQQHGEILQLFDSFDGVGQDASPEAIRSLLAQIKEHVVVHFTEEEFLFEKQFTMPADYVARHKAEHARLRDEVLAELSQLDLSDGAAVAAAVGRAREDLVRHIRDVDVQMNQYMT